MTTRTRSAPKIKAARSAAVDHCNVSSFTLLSKRAADGLYRDDQGIGNCGLGPQFCGDGCTSTCDYKSECDPGWGIEWSNATDCPLKVCCSPYGFCGTTRDYCGGKVVTSPSCSGKSANARTIGYYEGWNHERPCGSEASPRDFGLDLLTACQAMAPEDIPLGYYTHINFAFSLIDPSTFHLMPMDDLTGSLYSRVTALKARDPDLEVWIAVGGWTFNDPGATRTTFSDLAKSESAQNAFFESLITTMIRNGFQGVDIDWEYPEADDRGGIPEDYTNYVTFIANLRNRLNSSGQKFGISITLPASYWYLRHFDIVKIEPLVDFYNIMTYDIREFQRGTNA
jgi:chitinase